MDRYETNSTVCFITFFYLFFFSVSLSFSCLEKEKPKERSDRHVWRAPPAHRPLRPRPLPPRFMTMQMKVRLIQSSGESRDPSHTHVQGSRVTQGGGQSPPALLPQSAVTASHSLHNDNSNPSLFCLFVCFKFP